MAVGAYTLGRLSEVRAAEMAPVRSSVRIPGIA